MVDPKKPAPSAPAAKAVARRDGAVNVLNNDRVTMWDCTWKIGHQVRSRDAAGNEESKTFAAQDARFVPRGTIFSETATAGAPRIIVIELK
jgi:hypothetical protein